MAALSRQRFPPSVYGGRAILRCRGTGPADTGRLLAARRDPWNCAGMSRAGQTGAGCAQG